MSVTRKWSLLAAVLIVAILAGGWFLLVAPKRSEAVDLRDRTANQQEANERLLTQLAVLKEQQAELPKQRAELAVMRKQIPNNPALPSLIRSLTQSGRKTGVSIDSMAPAVPVAVVEAQPTAVVPTTTDSAATDSASGSSASSTDSSTGTSDTASSTGTTTTTTTPTAPTPAAPSLYQVPLQLDVTGSYFELEQFINKLEGLKRSFLVTGFTLGAAATDETATGDTASGGTSGTGDLTLKLQARVFLAPPIAPVAAQPTTPAATAATGQ